MKTNKRYLLPQWVLLPVLACSPLILISSVSANSDGMEDSALTLEDDSAVDSTFESSVETTSTEVVEEQQAMPTAMQQAKALAEEPDGLMQDGQPVPGGSMSYMGGNTRIGVGIDSKFKARIDATQVFSDTKDSVTSGEGWAGVNPKAKDGEKKLTGAGVKLNHHWVGKNGAGEAERVNKVFGAYDQNEHSDKKVTVGYGQETQNMFWSGQASFAKGTDRVITEATKTTDPLIERAYDYGVGARVGKFLPNQLMQVQGGVDVEIGKTFAAGEKRPTQVTISGGVEKFFADSPHSVGANLEVLNKMGGNESAKKTDARGNLSYRYEFGGANGLYSSDQHYKRVRVEVPGEVKVIQKPAKVERKMVKNTMELEGDTFFERGQAVLLPEAKQRLNAIMGQIRAGWTEGTIHIVGNTCDLGSDESNLALSIARADAVRAYFIEQGFDPECLLAEGLGEANPKYPNDDATRHRNRRVDIEYMTYQTDYKDVVVDEGSSTQIQEAPRVTWRQEVVKTPPKWVERALRNTIQHKRSIDTYRTGGTVNTAAEGNTIRANGDDYLYFLDTIGKSQYLDVLKNDSYVTGTKIKLISNPSNLALVVGSDGIDFTPSAKGNYSFTYSLVGPDGTESAPVTVNIVVTDCASAGKCTAIKLTDDIQSITLGDTETKTLSVLGNDVGDGLTIVSVSTPKYGTAVISADGKSIQYTLRYGYCADHSFTYTVKDQNGNLSQATVNIDIQ